MQKMKRSSLILTLKFSKLLDCCSRPSNAPARPRPPRSSFAQKPCSFPVECAPVCTKARSTGDRCSTARPSKSCAILATPEPSALGARVRRNSLTGRTIRRPFHRINGSFSCEVLTLGISPGRSTKQICISCSRIVPATREDRRHGPAREGPALLQGLVICGRCGNRMTLRYYQRKHGTRLYPEYLCRKEQIEQAGDHLCQQVLGAGLDAAITDLLLAQLTPLAIDTSLQVYEELHAQAEEARRLRAQQVERARYAAELAQRRFLRVDPENRLVADVLEADWNARLRELAQAQEDAERQNAAEQCRLTALEQQAIADLVNNFPRVWHDPRTSDRDRKRMVRLLLEDVTLLQQQEVITAQVRFKGGSTETITVAVSRGRRHPPQLLALIDQLLEDYTDAGVAEQLSRHGWRTFKGKPFDARRVLSLRRDHQLKDHGTRLRERGLLTADEAASAYGVCRQTIMDWGRAGVLPTYRINDHGMVVFPPPDEHAPQKYDHKSQTIPSSYERSAVCN